MKKNKNLLLILSMILATITVKFLFGQATGLIVTVLSLSILIMALTMMHLSGKLQVTRGWFILFALVGLSFTYVFRHQFSLQVLNILIFAGLFITYTCHMIDKDKFNISSKIIIQALEQFIMPFGEFKVPVLLIGGHLKLKKANDLSPKSKSVLIGILIALPVLLVFTALLASADDIFKSFITIDGFSIQALLDDAFVAKIIMWCLSLLYIFSYFYFLLFKEKNVVEKDILLKEQKYHNTIIQTVLILINLLFATFVFVQVKYLFVKDIIDGMTYSSYARKGFFELTVISLMVIALLIFTKSFITSTSNKILMTLMSISTLIIAYSAIFRLNLYIDVYGFTWLRLVSIGFIYLQIVILLSTMVYIWYKINIKVVVASVYLLAYITLNYINMDAIIIQQNMNRYYKGHELDTSYLSYLSYDSIDALLYYQSELKDKTEHLTAYNEISQLLNDKRLNLKDRDWSNYNYTIEHAKKLLK